MVQIFASLFHWLLEEPIEQSSLPSITLVARDRLILIFDAPIPDPNWIPLDMADSYGYECPFPYLQPGEQPSPSLAQKFSLADELSDLSLEEVIWITDEVLDQHNVPEEKQQEWKKVLGARLDNQVAQLLRILTGLIEHWQTLRQRRQNRIPLLGMADRLPDFSLTDACKPLIISLEERHRLQEKLRLIASKMRQQLRRTEEMMPVGRLQEMSPYCLRDYVRRPGCNPAEKAGSKQELMGVKRFQDYNTPENRFLVYFVDKILNLECRLYPEGGILKAEVDRFSRLIDHFKQQPEVQQIRAQHYQPTRPNYVLQQNPIYNSFYQAFLDWSQRKAEKERLWSFRHHLFGDALYLTLVATIGQLQGAVPKALDGVDCRVSPERGRYLALNSGSTTEVYIPVYLPDWVYVFRVRRSPQTSRTQADIEVIWERHDIHWPQLTEPECKTLKIWGFWYKPTVDTLAAASRYLNFLRSKSPDTHGLLIYLTLPPSSNDDNPVAEQRIANLPWLYAFPDLSAFTKDRAMDTELDSVQVSFMANACARKSFSQQVQQFWLARLQEWIGDG